MRTVVVAGNPKPQSKTLDAGLLLAEALGLSTPEVIDVVTLGPALFGWGDPAVVEAVALVQSADVVIFASPTYKATYTGVIKLFLDQFAGGTGLQGIVAVPLMLGAGPAHAMAPDVFLKPVLVELGAICPTPGLYQIDRTYAEDAAIPIWAARWAPVIHALAHADLSHPVTTRSNGA
ncbi:NADPH-dependent oxidoreductase [Cryobacterium frigoriphilum]|uniref:NADPH-dependent oxidoreductase n=1 Tax=Cryobacterium frigoriphilum TaxID=1259150 RepID=A0A4V3IRR6_9MICO|nr:NAD(P)H-dependent oxidoreductase [Cryobacterium frigoriphilum]TFD53330.1 NADPH-dependent oxidoreductase [Cryobacterium frigoriphilum]